MRAALAGSLVALTGMVAAGCGSVPRPEGPPPVKHGAARNQVAICGRLHARRTGVVRTPAADEVSGLVASRRRPGILWTHNDSGDEPRVFAIRGNGTLVDEVAITGAEAEDWEDIALRGGQLFIGDIGDNARLRSEIVVYRVPEPPPGARTAAATSLRLRYPDGAHNAETLLADPRSAALAVVTKESDGRSGVYVAAHPSATGATTLRRAATVELGVGGLATGGDVSADGRVIAVRTYTALVGWKRRAGQSLAAALRRPPCVGRVGLAAEGQGEALALARDGRAFWTVAEGEHPPIRRYTPAARP